MSIELNQATFRRLVQLYLLLFILSVAAVIWETIVWWEFVEAFDELTAERFGTPSDLQLFGFGGIGLAGGVAHLVAAFGLLKFKPWSRPLIWLSLLPMVAFGFIPGFQVNWSGLWSMWVEIFASALLGAIILLAYSRGHGEIWFRAEEKEVT
jgi:hypothetical protein